MMPGIPERVLSIIKNKTERAENLVWAKIRAVVMVLAFFCPRICYCPRITWIIHYHLYSSIFRTSGFIRVFIHPFTHSSIHSFTHSLIHSFTHSLIQAFTSTPSFAIPITIGIRGQCISQPPKPWRRRSLI